MGAAIGGFFMGVGIERAGNHIGDGIRDAATELGEKAKNGIQGASQELHKGMIESSQILANAGLKATDLASKRVCLTMLEGVANLSHNADQIVTKSLQMFTTENKKQLKVFSDSLNTISQNRVSELDRIADVRMTQLTNALNAFGNQLKKDSDVWKREVEKAGTEFGQKLVFSAKLHALILGIFIVIAAIIAAIIHAILVSDTALGKLIRFFSSFSSLMVLGICYLILPCIFSIIVVQQCMKAYNHYCQWRAHEALRWAYVVSKMQYYDNKWGLYDKEKKKE